LTGCIPDWTEFFKQAFRSLKPGGWLESYESSPTVFSDDNTLPTDSAISQWGPIFMEGGKKTGRTFAVLDDGLQNTAMKEAGFVDIQEKWIKVHFLIQFQSLLFTSSSPISAYVGPKRRLA
jgi:hypothetical protein